MGERVRVMKHDVGLLAAKEAGERGADALRAEAQVLFSVQGPGVVELIGVTDADPPALLTRWVGSRSLADVPVPLAPDRVAALCLAVAAVVGRLHRGGMVHGAVDPSHVLLDPHGRPVLCGFGSAGPIGASVRRPATDPGPGDDEASPDAVTTLRPALDVAGLGRLLDHLVGPTTSTGPGAGWRRSARTAAGRRKALRALASHASATDPAARPSVAGFAHAIRRAVPEAHLGEEPDRSAPLATMPVPRPSNSTGHQRQAQGRPAPAPAAAEQRRPVRRAGVSAVLAVIVAAATTFFGLSAWWAPSTERRADASPVASRPAPATTTTAPATSTTSTTMPLGPRPIVEHGGRRYEVGTAGDVVLVGPWLCDGTELPVVLHPADGTIHLFEGWVDEGSSLSARAVTTVGGATGLARSDRADCADLLVTDAVGTLTTLTPEDLR